MGHPSESFAWIVQVCFLTVRIEDHREFQLMMREMTTQTRKLRKKNDLVFPGHDSIVESLRRTMGLQSKVKFKLVVLSSGGPGRSLQFGRRGDPDAS
jgi:hypothetical protein